MKNLKVFVIEQVGKYMSERFLMNREYFIKCLFPHHTLAIWILNYQWISRTYFIYKLIQDLEDYVVNNVWMSL